MVSTVYHTEHGDFLKDTLETSNLTKKEIDEIESITIEYECPYTEKPLKKEFTEDIWGNKTVTFPAAYPEYSDIDISLKKELPNPEAFTEIENELYLLYRVRETGQKYSSSQQVNILFSKGFEWSYKILLYTSILILSIYSIIMLSGYIDLNGPIFLKIGIGLLAITSIIGFSRRYALKFILKHDEPSSDNLLEYEDLFKHFLFEDY